MILFTTNTRKMIKEQYKKELEELELLDKLMINHDYIFYNNIINKKIDNIYNDILMNMYQITTVLKNDICMSYIEYKELEEYEREVINEEIYNEVDYIIRDITEK